MKRLLALADAHFAGPSWQLSPPLSQRSQHFGHWPRPYFIASMHWLIFVAEQVAGCLIGLVVGFFGVAQPVMIIFAFIPWTLSLRREGALRNLAPLRRYLFAFTYLFLFLILASWLLVRYGPSMLPGYFFGLAF